VSRRAGIGFAIVERLLREGVRVFATGWPPHDTEMPWGPDEGVPEALEQLGADLAYQPRDLAGPDAPADVVGAVIDRFGGIDIVVANHARSCHQSLADVTVEELDRCWAVNARASVLLTQAFARHHDDRRSDGRVVLFTSGQHIAPMPDEIPYALSKGAIQQIAASLADALADRSITVNCVNPGPTDTGYVTVDTHLQVAGMFPARRWGSPSDVANLVAWLVSRDAAWITGQVLNSEGGFRRWVRIERD
jgi:3-oxoacyl-[acyl-carrier protein] reductase